VGVKLYTIFLANVVNGTTIFLENVELLGATKFSWKSSLFF